jgi:hypothetical protein
MLDPTIATNIKVGNNFKKKPCNDNQLISRRNKYISDKG